MALIIGAACSSGEQTPQPVRSSSRPNPVVTTQSVASGCHPLYPVGLNVSTRDPAELPYLRQVTACTNHAGSAVLLRNTGDVIWTPRTTTTQRVTVTMMKDTLRAQSFRTIFDQTALLVPLTDLVVPVAPNLVEWTLEPALTAAWQAHDHVADLIQKHGEQQLSDALAGNSKRRQAFATCTLSGYHAYEQAGNIRTGSPTEAMLAGWGLATGTGECALAWRAADQADAARNIRTATFADDLARMRTNVAWMSKTDDLLTILGRLGKAIVLVR
ncbi:hypothetical protein [Rhizocola hellebori]|nr:hypothetical protein [Rhizocola hellebori]